MNTHASISAEQLTHDRLYWLLASITIVLAPHFARLPVWVTGLFVVMAAWRLGAARMRWRMPPAWVRGLAALIGLIAVGVEFRAWGGQEAGTAMLVVMMSLKFTETVRKRDGLVILMIGYVLVIANFLYSQSILTGVYMLAAVWLVTATLLHLTHPTGGIPARERFRQAGVLLAQALPLAALLFVLFPRVPGPLWGMPGGQSAITGLTDRMEPGSIAQLSQSNAVAFRVTFDGPVPPNQVLYWRGPVLRAFDGRAWEQGTPTPTDGFMFEPVGSAVEYEVALEPHRHRWLFALDLPAERPPGTVATRTFQLLVDGDRVRERLLYRMRSHVGYRTGPDATQFEVYLASQLPAAGNPRSRQLAARLAAEHADPRDLIDAMLFMFRRDEYFYTLSPPLLGRDAVDGFLFETRRGFCEHYAGALAFVARAAGIPARVVLGYLGGEYNPVGDYLIVRQQDAHAWTEVYLADEGWVRVDPTAAVAPQRIEGGLDTLDALEGLTGAALRQMPLFNRLWLRWDDLNNRWNLFVLSYDRQAQQALLARAGFDDADYGTLVALLAVLVGAMMGALALWLLWQVRPLRVRDPAVRLYLKLQRLLERREYAA
jgi:protein-glutamine gamma-glutamyltransferase